MQQHKMHDGEHPAVGAAHEVPGGGKTGGHAHHGHGDHA